MRTIRVKISKEALKKKLGIKPPTAAELQKIMKPLIPKVKNGETPSEAKLRRLIRPLIPDPVPGEPGSPDTGEEIIKKINKDKSKKKIRKEKVEGWDELESQIRTGRTTMTTFMGANFIYLKDLSPQTDGVTKTFTVPTRSRSIMVVSSDAPGFLFLNNGFTETATTITLTTTTAPSAGSQLALIYVLI